MIKVGLKEKTERFLFEDVEKILRLINENGYVLREVVSRCKTVEFVNDDGMSVFVNSRFRENLHETIQKSEDFNGKRYIFTALKPLNGDIIDESKWSDGEIREYFSKLGGDEGIHKDA